MQKLDKRSITSRLNALKSTGQKTPEGKRRSAANSTVHGAYAKESILPGENLADFEALLEFVFDTFKPCGLIEELLVSEMTTTLWRLRRQSPAETSLIDIQIQRMTPALEVEFTMLKISGYHAVAVAALHKHGDGLSQIERHSRRLLAHFESLKQQFLSMRKLFPPPAFSDPGLTPVECEKPRETESIETKEAEPVETNQSEEAKPLEANQIEETPVRANLNNNRPARQVASENRVSNPQTTLCDALPPITDENPPPKVLKMAA